jgi:feruloyl esterase
MAKRKWMVQNPRGIGPIRRSSLLAGLAAVFGLLQAATAAEDRCNGLTSLMLPEARVAAAQHHPAGRFTPTVGAAFDVARAFCRVELVAQPTPSSEIRIEVWLPDAAQWNGQFWGLGNGSLAGQIPHRSLGVRVAAGNAAVATDTGHQADPSDARWALGQPEKVADYGHRATHLAAVHGKAVAAAYFDRKPSHAYFNAYSNGGRQALMLAQRYPDDYDGIMAGAPAHELTSLYIGWAQFQSHLLAEPAAHLSARQVEGLSSAALEACDPLDGVRDGVLENPLRCPFDPEVLACSAKPAPDCLTPPQLASVRRLYEGLRPGPGQPPVGGLAKGSEARWHAFLFGDKAGDAEFYAPVNEVLRHMVFDDPAWDLRQFQVDRDGLMVRRRLAAPLDAAGADIGRFVARGGKLILWHGWNDAVVQPSFSVAYHADLVRTLGAAAVARSIRLFMAPGVEHGIGGPGPDRFGQHSAGNGDPEGSLGAALRRWVEEGAAPERVTAVKHRVPNDPRTEVVRSRLVCAWPKSAVYRGKGSTDDAGSFDCAE